MRVLDYPYDESDKVSKTIDEICDDPGLTFKKLDAMKDGNEGEKEAWKKFHELEEKYDECFRIARNFEGVPRQMGIHASGVLVTPMPVTDMFPVRYDKEGTAITLYEGPTLEAYGAVKYDVLGLKTLDLIQWTLEGINKEFTIEDLYAAVDINDPKVMSMIQEKKTESVFQIESNMMKGIVDMIKPTTFNDIGAINAVGRPGPLSAGIPQQYGDVKNGRAEKKYLIHGCEDILDETFGCIIYQEQLMAISKKVSGFDDGQADSITRKITA